MPPSQGIRVGVVVARLFWLCVAAGSVWCGYEQYRLGEWPWRRPRAALQEIDLLKRSEWSAREPQGSMASMARPERITLHHSAGSVVTSDSREGAARAIQGVQREHMDRRRWSDIGYHYIVDRAGRVWEGRAAVHVGAHAGNAAANERNLGIVLLGNFELQAPSSAQLSSLERLVNALRLSHSIPRHKVLSHSAVRGDCGLGPTSCPGKHLGPWLQAYRRGPEKARKPAASSRKGGQRTASVEPGAGRRA